MSVIVCICLLITGAISDIKNRTVSIVVPFIGSITGIVLFFFSKNKEELAAGFVFGLFILMLSVLIKDFGIGDGSMILMLGILRGMSICMESVLIAFLITSVLGICLILTKRINEKNHLPFLPFLLFSYLAVEVAGRVI